MHLDFCVSVVMVTGKATTWLPMPTCTVSRPVPWAPTTSLLPATDLPVALTLRQTTRTAGREGAGRLGGAPLRTTLTGDELASLVSAGERRRGGGDDAVCALFPGL